MKILITGSSGQLGKSLNLSKPKNFKILNPNKDNCDLTKNSQISNYILENDPDWVINCGAYTNVENAESEKELAFQINSIAVKTISETLLKTKGKLIQISTDFVFNGDSSIPYKTNDETSPLNFYGFSKLKAEEYIRAIIKKPNSALVLRTSWLMSQFKNNFATKILKLHKEKESLNVVSDQIGSPTSALNLANICWEIIRTHNHWSHGLDNNVPIFHYSDSGVASWYDVALAVGEIGIATGLIKKMAEVNPVKSNTYISKAKRPSFSVLDSSKIKRLLNAKSMHWRKSMIEFFALINRQEI